MFFRVSGCIMSNSWIEDIDNVEYVKKDANGNRIMGLNFDVY